MLPSIWRRLWRRWLAVAVCAQTSAVGLTTRWSTVMAMGVQLRCIKVNISYYCSGLINLDHESLLYMTSIPRAKRFLTCSTSNLKTASLWNNYSFFKLFQTSLVNLVVSKSVCLEIITNNVYLLSFDYFLFFLLILITFFWWKWNSKQHIDDIAFQK